MLMIFAILFILSILGFLDEVDVMSSLQKPRKITAVGSDGVCYTFLCKPKDDLRKDAKVMEFNSLVNTLLKKDREANRRDLCKSFFFIFIFLVLMHIYGCFYFNERECQIDRVLFFRGQLDRCRYPDLRGHSSQRRVRSYRMGSQHSAVPTSCSQTLQVEQHCRTFCKCRWTMGTVSLRLPAIICTCLCPRSHKCSFFACFEMDIVSYKQN